jgi:hypothetical protein
MSKILENIVYENSRVTSKTGQKNVKNGAILGIFGNRVRNYLAFQEIPRKTAYKSGLKTTLAKMTVFDSTCFVAGCCQNVPRGTFDRNL